MEEARSQELQAETRISSGRSPYDFGSLFSDFFLLLTPTASFRLSDIALIGFMGIRMYLSD